MTKTIFFSVLLGYVICYWLFTHPCWGSNWGT